MRQFIRYFIVGIFAFIVDISCLYVLTEFFGIHYLISNIFSFSIGLVVNYTLSIVWVFEYRTFTDKQREFIIFAFIGLIGLIFGEILLWYMTIREIYYIYAKIIATGVIFLWNFLARKYILFYEK